MPHAGADCDGTANTYATSCFLIEKNRYRCEGARFVNGVKTMDGHMLFQFPLILL